MRSRRNIVWVVVAIVIIAGGIVTAVLLRKRAAPDAVRLLPDSDAVLYINLEPIRLLTDIAKHPAKDRESDYEEFVRETGFEFERDLNRAAFAIHYGVANGKGKPAETRYSEILEGHFDHARVTDWLRKVAVSTEHYQDYDIYVIPMEDRTVRVALLGIDIAAASNVDDAGVIHGMIDRYKQAALPFSGPSLVGDYYRRVPLGSIVWTIARTPTAKASEDHGELLVPGAWSGLLPRGSVVIASARPLNEVRLRADVLLRDENQAQRFTEEVATYLALFKSLEISMDEGGPDKDVKAAFDSLAIHQEKSEAVLTARVPYAFFKKVLSAPPVEIGPQTQTPPKAQSPSPESTPPKKK